jgi:hypothetical protein
MILAEEPICCTRRSPALMADNRAICAESSKENERRGINNITQINASAKKLAIPIIAGTFTFTDISLYFFTVILLKKLCCKDGASEKTLQDFL